MATRVKRMSQEAREIKKGTILKDLIQKSLKGDLNVEEKKELLDIHFDKKGFNIFIGSDGDLMAHDTIKGKLYSDDRHINKLIKEVINSYEGN